MHIKTYTGKSTQTILSQIKEELGPEAIILSNRSLRKGGERFYEITAGVERGGAMPTAPSAGASKSVAKAAYSAADHTAASQRVKQLASEVVNSGQFSDESETQVSSSENFDEVSSRFGSSYGASSMPSHPSGWSEWHKEWLQIKDHLFALMKPSIQMEKLTPRQRVALEYLQREGVSDVVILELYRRLLAAPGESVLESLSEIVPVVPWSCEAWTQRIHCFSGPFGVGKTTAALRMALQLRAQDPEIRIAFINADCQRGNGRLILRHWAELSDFSYTEAADAQSMKRALVSLAHMDKIFIDLPSLSMGQNLQDLYLSLGLERDVAGRKATHTVLSPTYDGAQLMNFLQRYAPDGAGSLVWAKLDESMSFGSLVNAAATCHLPVSALSSGAELRGTLVSASESLLWRLIFKRQLPVASSTQENQNSA